MNSNMVKPEKFGYLHLVYHFTVPLRDLRNTLLCLLNLACFTFFVQKIS